MPAQGGAWDEGRWATVNESRWATARPVGQACGQEGVSRGQTTLSFIASIIIVYVNVFAVKRCCILDIGSQSLLRDTDSVFDRLSPCTPDYELKR